MKRISRQVGRFAAIAIGLAVVAVFTWPLFAHAKRSSFNNKISPFAQRKIDRINEFVLAAQQAREKGDATLEEEKLRAVLQLDPLAFESHYFLAQLLDKQERGEEALEHYERIVNPPSDSFSTLQVDPRVLCRYAELCEVQGRSVDAEAAARLSLTVEKPTLGGHMPSLDTDPETAAELWANAFIAKSFKYFRIGEIENEITAIEDAIKSSPHNGVARFYHGYYLVEAKRYAEAKLEFLESKRLAPGNKLLVAEADEQLKKIGYIMSSPSWSGGSSTSEGS